MNVSATLLVNAGVPDCEIAGVAASQNRTALTAGSAYATPASSGVTGPHEMNCCGINSPYFFGAGFGVGIGGTGGCGSSCAGGTTVVSSTVAAVNVNDIG